MDVWTPVKVTNPDHPRVGEAGTIQSLKQADDKYKVKFDDDEAIVLMPAADLQAL